jgi:hypothetical protein
MLRAVVHDPGSGFAGDEDAGAGVPRFIAELGAGIKAAFGSRRAWSNSSANSRCMTSSSVMLYFASTAGD